MKNKKGFTLTELIAVIAILAIIVTIAGLGISKIRDNVLEGQKENVINTIKVEAKKYYSETGIKKVPVVVLIETGRIEADEKRNGESVVIDPVSNKSLNCSYVDFTDSDSGEWVSSDVCDDGIMLENAVTLTYTYKDKSGSVISSGNYDNSKENEWFGMANNQSLSISPNLGTGYAEYSWTTPNAPDLTNFNSSYNVEIPSAGYINDDIRLEVSIDGRTSARTFRLKADAIPVNISNAYVKNNDEWSQSKEITAQVTDNESGLKDYAISTSKTCSGATYKSLAGNTTYEINETIDSNGTYYICARDNAGNTTYLTEGIVVTKVDKNAPTISVTVNNGTTYTKSKTATITLTEKGTNGNPSGIASSQVSVKYGWGTSAVACSSMSSTATLTSTDGITFTGSATISSGTGAGKIYICPTSSIVDRAGNSMNTSNVAASTNMYLDNTVPSGSISISRRSGYNYNSIYAQYTISSLTDSHSGIDKMCITSGNESDCSWKTGSTGTFEYSFPSSDEGSGSTKKLTLYITDKAGNKTSASANYTLYTYCTDKEISSYGDWGSCSVSCGGGTQYRDVYYVDSHFTSHSCGTVSKGSSQTCNSRGCCSKVTYTETSTCSVDCGGGNYKRNAYSYYDGSRCSSEDDWNGSSCHTQSCCSAGYDDPINDNRYLGCDYIYVYSCQPTCNTNAQCNTSAGYVNRSNLSGSQQGDCKSICDYDGGELFGNYKGHISGNYGTWYSSLGYYYTCYNGSTCDRNNGYERVCATSACGSYKGWTARELKKEVGCDFASWWCSCSNSGQF